MLDRTKEPGATGEPLYLDVVTALAERLARGTRAADAARRRRPLRPVVQGVHAGHGQGGVRRARRRRSRGTSFTVGITDDVTGTSLTVDETFTTEPDDVFRAVFYGLGADGTVGANKNTIKIIGEDPDVHVQAYFVYDSKKSGSQTVSHLRFGPEPIQSTYLVRQAQFIGCHQFQFIEKLDVLALAAHGRDAAAQQPARRQRGVGLPAPAACRTASSSAGSAVWVIDADKVARAVGLGSHTNSVLQTCFFAVSGVLPREKAIEKIKSGHREDLPQQGQGGRAQELRGRRSHARRRSTRVEVPAAATGSRKMLPIVAAGAPRVRPGRGGRNAGRARRSVAGERLPDRRHVPERDGSLGEARDLG